MYSLGKSTQQRGVEIGWFDFHQLSPPMTARRLLQWSWLGLVNLLLLLGGPPWTAAFAVQQDTTDVRVRLNHRATVESVELTVDQGPLAVHLPEGGPPVMRLQSGESTTLGLRQNDVYIRRGNDGLYATKLRLQPAGTKATWALDFSNKDRSYTGGLTVAPAPDGESGLLVVNNVPLEDYVASVVANEYGLDDREGAKAMAVVARTYGLFASAKFGGAYDQADGTVSQVYEGVDAVTEASRQATQATEGEVLTHNGNLIQAVYFSSSGGHTANNEDVWNADRPIPYLRGKEDPYDSASPHHTWSTTIDRSALLQVLTRERGTLVEGFTIKSRSPDGRVETINVLQSNGNNHEMKANTFRLLVNRGVSGASLKSTWFDARRQGSQYVFNGRGFGHGVGLSQWGAHAMAQQGKTYREILRYYYTDVEIERFDGGQMDPVEAPVAKEPSTRDPDAEVGDQRIGW